MAEATRLLLIEDNPADARLIEIMLSDVGIQKYAVTKKDSFGQGMESLKNGEYDLVLLDLSLPDSFGLDTVKNANLTAPEVPIIVLTGRNDEDFAVEVVKAGAQDYLVKGQIDSALLSRAIRYAMQRKEMEVDLKLSNRKTEESQALLNLVVSNNISGIVLLGQGGIIRFMNPAAEKILGKISTDLIGKKFKYEYSLEGPTLVAMRSADMLIEVLAVKTDWGGEEAVLITLHDITELKKAEESLRMKNNELTRINKALDRFVYIISHDLKKPTANIIGLLSLYEKDLIKDSERGKTIYDKLNFSAFQLKKMIEDLLEATKKEINTEQNYELIDFKKIYHEAASQLERLIAETNTKIKTDFSRYPLIFYSHQDLLSILSNLLSNAIKYRSPERLPEIFIKTDKAGTSPTLTIQDNGIGINLQENRDKLFRKYQRLNKGNIEGTGLGLWIIKETLEKNGGRIEVESEPGKGTKFTLYF